MISERKLVEAIRKKWREEHPEYEDTGGSMTYMEIIRFIEEFAKNNRVED